MGGLFGGAPKVQPKPAPVAPRLSDMELKARDEARKTAGRQGIEDQILSLGRVGSGDRPQRGASLLGRAGS